MADLGSIAAIGLATRSSRDQGPRWALFGVDSALRTKAHRDQGPRAHFRRLVCGDQAYALGGRDNAQGNPSPPSLRLDVKGTYRLRWTVAAGARSISIDVKQAVNLSPRPRVTVIANPDIGVSADVQGSAGGGTGWVTIGPISVTPSSAGALWVILEALYDGQSGCASYWDHIVTT